MKNERGNILFYILIAVALLAALSYAIARSNRDNVSQLSTEKARLLATELLEYADSISSAVSQMKLRGVKDTKICFADAQSAVDYDYAGCSDDFNKIFNLDGGGISWTKIPEDATQSSALPDFQWHFLADNEVKNVGTTCAAASCSDLLLVAEAINPTVCQEINELLGVTASETDPPTNTDLGVMPYKGVYDYTNTIGNPSVNGVLDGKSAACFHNATNNSYVFYKVLVSR